MAAERHRRMPDLPPEIQLFHILPWLPARSIARFMSVSKQWRSFLKSPQFMAMHLENVTNGDHQNQRMYLLSLTQPTFHTIDCESPEDGLAPSRAFPFKASFENLFILASFHGLVCVCVFDDIKHVPSDLVIWNPLTGEHKTLSKGRYREKWYNIRPGAYGMYYNSSDKDYKLLRIAMDDQNAYIYSLRRDSWRKVKPTCRSEFEIGRSESFHLYSVFLNGKLYFLSLGGSSEDRRWSSSIIAFDIKTEKFTRIKTPFSEDPKRFVCMDFRVVEGFVHLYAVPMETGEDYKMDVWRMGGDGDGDWTKVGCFCAPKTLIVGSTPFHQTRNGKLLMLSSKRGGLVEVDSKMGVSKMVCSYGGYRFGFWLNTKFIETLVSPNRKRTRRRRQT